MCTKNGSEAACLGDRCRAGDQFERDADGGRRGEAGGRDVGEDRHGADGRRVGRAADPVDQIWGSGPPSSAVNIVHYLDALRLSHGPAGDTLARNDAATAAFAGVDGEFFDATLAAADLTIRERRTAGMLTPLRTAAGIGRFNEPIRAALITALAVAGHQAEALAEYREIHDRLTGEIGIEPGAELRETQRQVLTQIVAPTHREQLSFTGWPEEPARRARPSTTWPGSPSRPARWKLST